MNKLIGVLILACYLIMFTPYSMQSISVVPDGKSYYSDGVDNLMTVDSVVIPWANLNASVEMTLECWYYPVATGGGVHLILQCWGLNVESVHWHWYAGADLKMLLQHTISPPASTVPMILKAWNHVALTFRPNDHIDYFLNGVFVGGGACDTIQNIGNAGALEFGSRTRDSLFGENYIDDVRVYFNVIKSTEQIANDMWVSYPAHTKGLEAFYPMDESIGNVMDIVGGHHATSHTGEDRGQNTAGVLQLR